MLSQLADVQQRALLSVLFQGEEAVRRRCTIVALRLEFARGAMVLLEVACHAHASLEDLDTLASARGLELETLSTRLRWWAFMLVHWVGHLWSASTFRDYRGVLGDLRHNLVVADRLGRTCVECGDRRMADWCALWTEQRRGLAARLESTLADVPLSVDPVELRTLASSPDSDERDRTSNALN